MQVQATKRRPAATAYAADDRPPPKTLALAALLHVGLTAINLISVLTVIRAAGVDDAVGRNALSIAMLMCGFGTLLQSMRRGPIGCGLLLPAVTSTIYLGPALAAVRLGGLPMLAGMLLFAGIVEMLLSRVIHRLRPYFPPEIAGLVMFLVGVTIGMLGVRDLLGIDVTAALTSQQIGIAALTLGITVVLQAWGRGTLALAGPLIGMVVGYGVAGWSGEWQGSAAGALAAVPLIAAPDFSHLGWAFDATLILPFALSALAASVNAVGMISLAQRVNDADWVRPDMSSIARGLFTDGLTTAVGGAAGAVCGGNPGSASSGLIVANGVASRAVAWPTAALLVAMAFVPVAPALVLGVPKSVSGAVQLFTACFILSNGLQMIASRMLDGRKSLVIGLSILAGLAVESFPHFFARAPAWALPVLGSALVTGALLGLILNGIFRIGQRQRGQLSIDASTHRFEDVQTFMEQQGARWGARRDVMARVSFTVDQLIAAIQEHGQPSGPIRLDAAFDEFSVRVDVSYPGLVLPFPDQRPTLDAIVDSEDGVRQLAGYLLRRGADRIVTDTIDRRCRVRLFFEH